MVHNFLDKDIIKFKNQINQLILQAEELNILEEEFDFEKGFIVFHEQKIDVKKVKVKEWFEIFLPKDFHILTDDSVQLKYPAYQNPNKVIFTNEDTTINILFDFQEVNTIQEDIPEIRDEFSEMLLRLYPASKILKKDVIETYMNEIAYFSIITPTLEQPIFNYMFYFQVQDGLISGSCNCLETEQDYWEALFLKILETIDFIKNNEEA